MTLIGIRFWIFRLRMFKWYRNVKDFCSSEFGAQYPQSVVYKRKTMRKEHWGQLMTRKGKIFCKGFSIFFQEVSARKAKNQPRYLKTLVPLVGTPTPIQILLAFRCAAFTVDSTHQMVTALINIFFKARAFFTTTGAFCVQLIHPLLWIWGQDQFTGTENTSAPGCCVFKSSNTGYMVYPWPLRWWDRTAELRQLKDKEFVWAFISS